MPYSNNNPMSRQTRPGSPCPASGHMTCARPSEERFCPENFPVGMAYVPWQAFGDPYDPETGMIHGTLFPSLNLPFLCANPACGSPRHTRGGRS